MNTSATFVIIGGGISGVTCVENLSFFAPNEKVILVTASPLIKSVTSIVPLSKTVYKYNISEGDVELLKQKHSHLEVIYDKLKEIKSSMNCIFTKNGHKIQYKYLCLCTGGIPNILNQAKNNPRVIGIRDTDSVENFQKKLKESKRIVIVGNGGIASELINATKGVELFWVIKDKHISSTFIDPGAAEFFQSSSTFNKSNFAAVSSKTTMKRIRYTEGQMQLPLANERSAALGPDWLKDRNIYGDGDYSLKILYETHVVNILNKEGEWPLEIKLSNGEAIDCDLLVSATGVVPASDFISDKQFELGPDGGIAVNWRMETSVSNIFAAGDVAFANWTHAAHWFQMRLWSQAYQMGGMAAKSMHGYHSNEEVMQDFCFEIFTHTTKLFDYQVVLLGKYNGQGLGTNYEILIRTTPNMEYIKFVLVDNKLQGVILIGETGLEETCENLILNQLDLSPYGDDILNPDIDIEDYFD